MRNFLFLLQLLSFTAHASDALMFYLDEDQICESETNMSLQIEAKQEIQPILSKNISPVTESAKNFFGEKFHLWDYEVYNLYNQLESKTDKDKWERITESVKNFCNPPRKLATILSYLSCVPY